MPGIATIAPGTGPSRSSAWFKRLVLPGLAFKAVVIGGGYATGREIAEFFLPSGFWGGLAGIGIALVIWSGVCALTFLFAFIFGAADYRQFFRKLIGGGWIAFEFAYALFVILILAVFGAAAGEIAQAVFGFPKIIGMLALMGGIVAVVAFGNRSVERLFVYVSVLLYTVYAVFLILSLHGFGDRIASAASMPFVLTPGWLAGGVTYAAYNVIGAVIVLPVTRHLQSEKDAVIAGLIAGPLAMLPAILFFVCMSAFTPQLAAVALPSDFLLGELGHPWFRVAFQVMIFAALLESGSGSIHAINQRIATMWEERRNRELGRGARALLAAIILAFCMVVADRFGLVTLIAKGYRALAYVILAIYVLPLLTIGVHRLRKRHRAMEPT